MRGMSFARRRTDYSNGCVCYREMACVCDRAFQGAPNRSLGEAQEATPKNNNPARSKPFHAGFSLAMWPGRQHVSQSSRYEVRRCSPKERSIYRIHDAMPGRRLNTPSFPRSKPANSAVLRSHPQRAVPPATPPFTFLWRCRARRNETVDRGKGVHAWATAFSFGCITRPAHRCNNLFLTSLS